MQGRSGILSVSGVLWRSGSLTTEGGSSGSLLRSSGSPWLGFKVMPPGLVLACSSMLYLCSSKPSFGLPSSSSGCLKCLCRFFCGCGRAKLKRYNVHTYALGNPKTVSRGCLIGCTGCFSYLFYSVWVFISKTWKNAKRYGVFGALYGLFLAPVYAIWSVLYGPFILCVDRFLVGAMNEWCGRKIVYCIDPSVRSKTYSPCSIEEEVSTYREPSESRLPVLTAP